MSNKDTVFYKKNKAFLIDFNARKISSEGGLLLIDKFERKHKLIKYFSKFIKDERHPSYTQHTAYNLLKQRVLLLMQGYEDANDIDKLKNDPILNETLENRPGSQPTISRFENAVDKHQIFSISDAWIDRYVANIGNRKKIIIDADATDAETFGKQQLSLFNGFYAHTMYNELFFHDGETCEIILPVLRPGNAHSNWWYVGILKRIVKKIKLQHPDIEILFRADSGFSTPVFYNFARNYSLNFTVGIAANNILKTKTELIERCVSYSHVSKKIKHQVFTEPFNYQAGTWDAPEKCYAKVESTGKGLNVRYFISNFEEETGREIYKGFYVKRGDTSENRIKEVKNMCFSTRMSNHNFWANFFRLIISSIAYEMFRLIKVEIKKTNFIKAKKWQINNIRLFLLKVGGTIKKTKRRIIVSLSNSFVYKDLYMQLMRV
jgi:hypothetical protein